MDGTKRGDPRESRSRSEASRQLEIAFVGRGGRRPGAGRKPAGERPRVPHGPRPEVSTHVPVLITTRLKTGCPTLRCPVSREAALGAFRAARGGGRARVVCFSLQSNHVHMVVEALDAQELSRGMQGLLIRLARALNRGWARKGPVFADRYHARVLSSPREVRNALAYVLCNASRHGARLAGIDPYSSGAWFDGWRRPHGPMLAGRTDDAPTGCASSWLLRVGWRRHGEIDPSEVPGGRGQRSRAASVDRSDPGKRPRGEAVRRRPRGREGG